MDKTNEAMPNTKASQTRSADPRPPRDTAVRVGAEVPPTPSTCAATMGCLRALPHLETSASRDVFPTASTTYEHRRVPLQSAHMPGEGESIVAYVPFRSTNAVRRARYPVERRKIAPYAGQCTADIDCYEPPRPKRRKVAKHISGRTEASLWMSSSSFRSPYDSGSDSPT